MRYIMFCGMQGHGPRAGIHRFLVDCGARSIEPLDVTAQAEPQFLRVAPDGRALYAVGYDYDGGEPGLYAYAVGKEGALRPLNRVSCHGNGPNFLCTDRNGNFLLSANYRSGDLVVTRIATDGSLGEKVCLMRHEGHGPNPDRQEKPHAHILLLSDDDRYAYSCDLGIDKIMVYGFDAASGQLCPAQPPFYGVPAGEGPRHIALHPGGEYAYMLTELGGKLFTYQRSPQSGGLCLLGVKPLAPAAFAGENFGSELRVHPDGRTLVHLNRGHDSVCVWSLQNPATPEPIQFVPSGGETPRAFQFTPDGNCLVVANQDGNALAGFDRLPDGTLRPWPRAAEMPRPMSVSFLPEPV